MKTNEVKVSVIVPVYNTAEYLKKCIESITKQSLTEIEIIILNDRSPDDSEDIILGLAEKDNRIKYLKHDNIGLGMTRNRGIKVALGEYLAFVDSDDFIEPDMLGKMYEKVKAENLDVAVCETYINDASRQYVRKKFKSYGTINLKKYDIMKFLKETFFSNSYRYCAWDKIYRTSFIVENGIEFGDNRKIYAEDAYFQFHILTSKPSIGFIDKPLCHYVQREGSITDSVRQSYITRHMNMINHFYDESEGPYSIISDIMLFRGLLNEASYSSKHKLGLKSFRESMRYFYKDKSYNSFMVSTVKNKSGYIISPWKRRVLFNVFIFLQRIGLVRLSESILYAVKYNRNE